MENLNKENFWNEIYEKYPDAVKEYCDWIDEYKKENNWEILFNGGLMVPIRGTSTAPKYHDLPLAMQTGIFTEYMHHAYNKEWIVDTYWFEFPVDWKVEIEGFFELRQDQIKEYKTT